jgi:hypothetical protein
MYGGGEVLRSVDAVTRVLGARGSRAVSLVLFSTGKFGVDAARQAAIAELSGGQISVTDDWTHIRWAAVAR